MKLLAKMGLMATFAALLSIGIVGCNSDQGADEGGASEGSAADGGEGGETSSTTDGQDEITQALASLSPEDRAAAEKQKICPVTGEALGSMGAPKKVSVKGRDVFICCGGCEKEITGDPDKYLAKLDQ